MRPSLVDVAVCIHIWIRPLCTNRQFQILCDAAPSKMFLISDGGRNEYEKQLIIESRKVFEQIDWECEVYKFYFEENHGLYGIRYKYIDFIWSKVDSCIILEDDDMPSVSYFKFCAEMLSRYKDDLRISYISGMNVQGVTKECDSDYFFSGEGSIHGIAIWKRTEKQRTMIFTESSYTLSCIVQVAKQLKPGYEKIINGYVNDNMYQNHIAGCEFYKNLTRFSQNQVCIVPKYNLLFNQGIGTGSTHATKSIRTTPKAIQKLELLETYEIKFPLKHPQYVVRNVNYEKYVNRLLAWNMPFIQLSRKIETFIRLIIFGEWDTLLKRIKKYFLCEKEK